MKPIGLGEGRKILQRPVRHLRPGRIVDDFQITGRVKLSPRLHSQSHSCCHQQRPQTFHAVSPSGQKTRSTKTADKRGKVTHDQTKL